MDRSQKERVVELLLAWERESEGHSCMTASMLHGLGGWEEKVSLVRSAGRVWRRDYSLSSSILPHTYIIIAMTWEHVLHMKQPAAPSLPQAEEVLGLVEEAGSPAQSVCALSLLREAIARSSEAVLSAWGGRWTSTLQRLLQVKLLL